MKVFQGVTEKIFILLRVNFHSTGGDQGFIIAIDRAIDRASRAYFNFASGIPCLNGNTFPLTLRFYYIKIYFIFICNSVEPD